MSGVCDNITMGTDCSHVSDTNSCNACKRLLSDTKCAGITVSTNCSEYNNSGSGSGSGSGNDNLCYLCQNFHLQNAIANGGGLANSFMQTRQYRDAYLQYWNEISKTVYLSAGIAGILAYSYYIR